MLQSFRLSDIVRLTRLPKKEVKKYITNFCKKGYLVLREDKKTYSLPSGSDEAAMKRLEFSRLFQEED
jgi:DNA-binding IclR family transcriptional regulator